MITTERGWIDTAGKTRTWALLDTNGRKIAEITTKQAAQDIADRLNKQEGK